MHFVYEIKNNNTRTFSRSKDLSALTLKEVIDKYKSAKEEGLEFNIIKYKKD